MSQREHTQLGRRLWSSARRERPSAELHARVLAAGHAERARVSEAPVLEPRSERLARRAPVPRAPARRALWLGALGALAAAALAFVWTELEAPEDVLISAERASGGASAAAATATARELITPGNDTSSASATTGTNAAKAAPDIAAPTAPSTAPRSAATPRPPSAPRNDAAPQTAPEATRSPSAPGTAAPSARSTATPGTPPPSPDTPPPSPGTPPPSPDTHPSLATRLDQIKDVRSALRAGNPERALALLDAQGAQTDALVEEASLLRIEALAAAGRRTQAEQAAREFARRYPSSPLIDRALSFASGQK